MNRIQAGSLFAAVLSFLAIIPMFFFAATEHKNALVFFGSAILFAFSGAVSIYRFIKARKI